MATLGWLKFRDFASFVFFALLTRLYIYMEVPSFLSNGLKIRETSRPSRKC